MKFLAKLYTTSDTTQVVDLNLIVTIIFVVLIVVRCVSSLIKIYIIFIDLIRPLNFTSHIIFIVTLITVAMTAIWYLNNTRMLSLIKTSKLTLRVSERLRRLHSKSLIILGTIMLIWMLRVVRKGKILLLILKVIILWPMIIK